MNLKSDLKSMDISELKEFFLKLGQPSYRAEQLFSWMHRGISSFDEMSNLPLSLRKLLGENAYLTTLTIKKKLVSQLDGTTKYLFELNDGECIESVMMRYRYGNTICISTQVGCRMNCGFCASGIAGLKRSLKPSEMLEQILAAKTDSCQGISHCVLMGIGEPLDNYDNVIKFLSILSAPGGLNMSMRHVSLSTCGLVDRIYQLMELKLQITLSISLHAPNDELRTQLMPVNRRWGIDQLLKACSEYTRATGRRISFEYALLKGINDMPKHARQLGEKLKDMLCHVNLIPVNEVKEMGYQRSPESSVRRFYDILLGYGLNVTVRRTLGADINASCGQLRRSGNL